MSIARGGITARIIDFTLGLRLADLPPPVRDEARNGLLDTLGVALAGVAEEPAGLLRDVQLHSGGGGACTVLGDARTTAPTTAAQLNAYAAHVLDFDDTQHGIGTHMSAPVIPAALAVGELLGGSGADLAAAYVAGFEVGCALARAGDFADHLLKRRLVASSMLGVFGATVAAARMAGLNAEQLENALGIAAGHASGLTMAFGTMAKAQAVSAAAGNAVLAVLLARQGFSGPAGIFDGERNFFASYGGASDAAAFADELGRRFSITTNTRKIFACAGWRNPIIECGIHFAGQGVRPQDVESMEVRACMEVKHLPNYPVPAKGLEAKFSAEYAAAVGLTDRAGAMQQFSDERVADPALIELTRRVKLVYDPELGSFQIRMKVRLRDGRELEHFIPVQKGKHLNPMSWAELAAKFSANAALVLPAERTAPLVDMIAGIEKLDDVRRLSALCRSAAASPEGA